MESHSIYKRDNAVRVVEMSTSSLELFKSIIDLVKEYNTKNSTAIITIEFTKTHVIFKNTVYASTCINYIEVPSSWFLTYNFHYFGQTNPEVNIDLKTLQKVIEKCMFMKSKSINKTYTISVAYINGNEEKHFIIEHADLHANLSFDLISSDNTFEYKESECVELPPYSLTIDAFHIHNIFNMFYGKTEDMRRFSVTYKDNKLIFTNKENMSVYSIETKGNVDDQLNKSFNSVCLHGLFSSTICNSTSTISLHSVDSGGPLLWRFNALWGQTVVKYYIWSACLFDEVQHTNKKHKTN